MNLKSYLGVVVGFCLAIAMEALEYDSSVVIRLQHSLVGGPNPIYSDRGNISIHSLKLGQAIVEQKPLSENDVRNIQDLARNNEFYRLKSTVTANDGTEKTFLSTVKACMLAEAELDDRLSISLDYFGRVIGVTLVIASKSTCEGAEVPESKLKEFTTSVHVRQTETGPVPDTASYIAQIEREKESREKGDTKDNRSFLAKYWMYIVPVVIVMVISSATNPEAGGGGGQ